MQNQTNAKSMPYSNLVAMSYSLIETIVFYCTICNDLSHIINLHIIMLIGQNNKLLCHKMIEGLKECQGDANVVTQQWWMGEVRKHIPGLAVISHHLTVFF